MDKLQKIYYIIGIVQRIAVILLLLFMIGATYKIYNQSSQSLILITQYGNEIKEIKNTTKLLYKLVDKSWFF